MDMIILSTPGNATDFGDLMVARYGLAACSNGIDGRGVFGGGRADSVVNDIDYISIQTLVSATDFGDLTVARDSLAACADA